MSDVSFSAYHALTASEERAAFRQAMETKGYYAFYAFVEDFRQALKLYTDPDIEAFGDLLQRSKVDFPQPQLYSPSWTSLWEEFEMIYHAKNETMAEIPDSERDGEWQVLIDNPYLPHQVACYPGLSFVDAAYTYAYFQKDLKPNEVLRLQRISLLLAKSGRKEASMLPDT